MEGDIYLSKRGGKTVIAKFGVWYTPETGHIHFSVPSSDWLITTVCNESGSKRYHPNLYRKLARLLKENGAPYPELADLMSGED